MGDKNDTHCVRSELRTLEDTSGKTSEVGEIWAPRQGVRRVVHVTRGLVARACVVVVDRAVLRIPFTVLAAAASDVGRHSPKTIAHCGTLC